MVNTNKPSREAKLRIARMEANQKLHRERVSRRKRDNVIALIAMAIAVLVATVLALSVFAPTDDGDAAATDVAATDAVQSATATTQPSAPATAAAAQSNSPTVPDAATAQGKVFTGTLSLNGQPLDVELDGSKAPQAAAVFKSLADSGFMTGKSCHRLANSPNFGLLQCGSPAGDGQGDPNYQWGPVENTPADGMYPAGTIAVARANSTFSNGTQFFITFADTVLPQETGGYTVVGKVTSGLEAVTAIAEGGIAGDGTDGAPKTQVTIDSFQIN